VEESFHPDGWKEIKLENEKIKLLIPELGGENWLGLEFYLCVTLVFGMMGIWRRNLEISFLILE
jgi:hypothetical protein